LDATATAAFSTVRCSDKVLYISTVPAKFVRPCIPTTAKTIPRGDAWLYEPKLGD
jgi:hypothetical protein